jgi:glycogen synthase
VYQGRQDVNLMKGAMMMADAVTTVSPTYARELHHPQFGQGLQGVIDYVDGKLYGILNGIDIRKQVRDFHIALPSFLAIFYLRQLLRYYLKLSAK